MYALPPVGVLCISAWTPSLDQSCKHRSSEPCCWIAPRFCRIPHSPWLLSPRLQVCKSNKGGHADSVAQIRIRICGKSHAAHEVGKSDITAPSRPCVRRRCRICSKSLAAPVCEPWGRPASRCDTRHTAAWTRIERQTGGRSRSIVVCTFSAASWISVPLAWAVS